VLEVWILVGVAVGLAAVGGVLAVALRRVRERARDVDRVVESTRGAVRRIVDEEVARHAEEIRLTLARERATSISTLAEEERRLGEARRVEFVERERRAAEELADRLGRAERRLDERLRGFTDDLDRSQRHVEQQITRLATTQQAALSEVEARISADTAALGTSADEQRQAIHRLREELERAASHAVAEALEELEASTAERRRAIEEITERLRQREVAIAESLERAETDVRARLDVLLVEWERRQTERLGRVIEREVERHAQIALQQLDERLRVTREDAVVRLRRELDRTVDVLMTEEVARRLGTPP
jgi:hypothetical protein